MASATMADTTTTTTGTRVWAGCLACHNARGLVGRWVDVADVAAAAEDGYAGVHELTGCTFGNEIYVHEEVGFFDHDDPSGLLGSGEPTLARVVRVAELLDELDDEEHAAAVAAYVDNHYAYGLDEVDDVAELLDEVEEAYRGRWPSFEEYAAELADDLGMFQGQPQDSPLRRYFDYEAWARDLLLGGDYWTAADGGEVLVFDAHV